VPVLARNTALSVPDSPVSMMAADPLVRVTADHLALVRGLINAGQAARALELLDAVWHPRLAEEQCWYLRLWVLAAEGRVLEALDLARVASQELPGSAAVAYLQAALEHVTDSPAVALSSARRAMTIAPDHPLPALLVALLLQRPGSERARPGSRAAADTDPQAGVPAQLAPGATIPNPIAAAQLGAALLFPLGSGRALVPAVAPVQRKAELLPRASLDRRRFGFIAVATAVSAVWAIHDPLPAALVLALTVALALRGWRF
jgi:hypothetical protein